MEPPATGNQQELADARAQQQAQQAPSSAGEPQEVVPPRRLQRPTNIREQMPNAADLIEQVRAQMGVEYTNKLVVEGWKRGATSPFWALDGWYVVGFPPDEAVAKHLNQMLEEEAAAFAPPEDL